MGVTICHLINSLHSASTYGRHGLSSNVGNRSLPITISSSACARLCTCGKRTRAKKREVIEVTVLIVGVSERHAGISRFKKYSQCLNRLKTGLISPVHSIHKYASPWYNDPKDTLMTSSCFWRSETTKLSNSCRCSLASECTAVPLCYHMQQFSTWDLVKWSPHTKAVFTKLMGSFLIFSLNVLPIRANGS